MMIKISIILLVVIASIASAERERITLGYFPSWSENSVGANNVAESLLAQTPSSTSHVFLAFAKPNLQYTKGSYDIRNTGLEIRYSGQILKSVIQLLKDRGTKVILSVGGETYWRSGVPTINYQQIADLVKDIGFSGIDWDFEPNGTFDTIGNADMVRHFVNFIKETRKVLPKSEGYLIAVAPAGCGALGGINNDDTNSPYKYSNRNTITGQSDDYLSDFTKNLSVFGFASTGHMIPVFKQVGDEIDIVAYQGYNVGGAPNRYLLYQSYAYYANKHGFVVAAGVHVPNEPWGPLYISNALTTAQFAKQILDTADRSGKGDGIMVWQLLAVSAYSGERTHTGKSYLNIARNVFNGQTPENAVSNAFNFPAPGSAPANPAPANPAPANPAPANPAPANPAPANPAPANPAPANPAPANPAPANPAPANPAPANPAPANPAPANPAPANPAPANSGEVSPWSASTTYETAGIRVTYNGRIYESKYYTANETPDTSGAWRDVTPFDPNNIPAWNRLTTYDRDGYVVSHNGQNWQSRWWTLGNEPGQSEVWRVYP